MTDLPNKSDLNSGTATEAEFQSAIGDLYDFIDELGVHGDPELNECNSSGVITPSKAYIQVDTETGTAATDDLNRIVASAVGKKMIILRSTSSARVVTVKHNQSGSGKMWLNGAADFVLRDPSYAIAFAWDTANSRWQEVWRNIPNFIPVAEQSSIRSSLGLGTAATRDTGTSTGQIPLRENFGTAAFVNTGTGNGQVPLANQLGTLAFLSQVTDSQLNGTGVSPGTYDSVTVNAQGRVTGGTALTSAFSNIVIRVFTTVGAGTYTPTAGMKFCDVEVQGGGGYAGAFGATAGGTSTFGSWMTANGGAAVVNGGAGVGGTASGGTINIQGGCGFGSGGLGAGGKGGDSMLGFGGWSYQNQTVGYGASGYGGGGVSSSTAGGTNGAGWGAGGGGYCRRVFSAADIGASKSFVVGGAGTGTQGIAPTQGVIIITEYL